MTQGEQKTSGGGDVRYGERITKRGPLCPDPLNTIPKHGRLRQACDGRKILGLGKIVVDMRHVAHYVSG